MKFPWPFTRKSLAQPEDWLLQLLGGATPSATGVKVSVDLALRVPAVSAAVQTISEAVASLDVMVKAVDADGKETDDPKNVVLPLLRDAANDWTSGFDLIRDLVASALTNDQGGMAHVLRNSEGKPVEIIQYRPGVIRVTYDQVTGEPSYTVDNRKVKAADVIHVRSPLGNAPVTLAREAIGIAIVMQRHAARLFGRGARPSGGLMFPKGMGEESVKKARAAWRATHEGDDAGGQTAILYDGAEFKPFTFNSVDSQFQQLWLFVIQEIARAFNIPAPMLGDLSRATWSNSEQKGREFLSYCLEPWLRSVEGALRRALFSEDGRKNFVIRFDRDDLTRADLTARATAISSLISSRTINPNEARAWMGMPPRAEGGDEFANPNTGNSQPGVTAPPAPTAQPAPKDKDDTDADE
jgi:HK97 family phage portal protein